MQSYRHVCPHCGAQLSIQHLAVEKTVSRCPQCKKYIVVDNYGRDTRKPNVYHCPKCGDEQIFDGRPPLIRCEKCNNMYITSAHGVGMVELGLLSRGDKGELSYKKKKDQYINAINKWLSLTKTVKVSIISAIVACVAIIIGIYIFSLPPAIHTSMAYADMDSLYNEFSEKNPYNMQIECIRNYDDNSKVIIISEPSDFVSEEELKTFFKPYNSYVKTYKRKIGFDGWMKDFVVAFNDLDNKHYNSFIKGLSNLLYKTDYKASIVDISTMIEHTPYLDYDLNYNITTEELKEWFIDNEEAIRPLEDKTNNITSLALVLDNEIKDGMQLYTSVTPGFVIWTIDKSQRPDELNYRINARKFSLDSDLILGAISKNNNVAIIARERCIPTTQLPPMRSETLCLLSYTTDDELSQSYERNNLFAGKQTGSDGGKDYAPILLSDALWHTEYGNILNVTDQMLKSWSENGMIDYIDFNYPKPVFWGFDKGAMHDLGVSQLTYNWNTEGVGYIVEDSDYSVYALNRTGSLPVSYIPGDATQTAEQDPVYQAEQNAYNFFSSLSNPELVKVVQYAAMYQIFQNFDIHMQYDKIPYYDDNKFVMPYELEYEASNILKKIGNYNANDRGKIAAFYNAKITTDGTGLPINDDYGIVSNNQKLPKDPFALVLSAYFAEELDSIQAADLGKLLFVSKLIPQIDTLHNCISPIINDEDFISSLGKAMIDRNRIDDIVYSSEITLPQSAFDALGIPVKSKSKDEKVADAFNAVFDKNEHIKTFTEIFSKYNHNKAKLLMVEENADRSRTWMKTPTVVESWSLVDSTNQVGGHNLNSKVTRFRVADDLKPGQTREITVGNKKIIEVSRVDSKSHITDQSYLRRVGRLDDATIKGEAVKTRPRNIVADVASKRSSRGFNSTDHTITIGRKSFTYANKEYESLDALIGDFCKSSNPDEVLNLHIECLEGSGVKPKMVINNINCRLSRGNTMLPMSKFDFSHATQINQGDNVLFTIPIKSGVMDLGSTSYVNRAGLGGSSNVGVRVNVCDGNISFKIVNKSKMSQIISIIKDFFRNSKGYFNEFRLKMLFKQHGIEVGVDVIPSIDINVNNAGITEQQYLMIAMFKFEKYQTYDIQLFKEEEIA